MAIDQSTQSTKISIISNKGKVVYTDKNEHKQIISNENWIEHNANEILENFKNLLKNLLNSKKRNFEIKDISYCGITNQRETLVVWNKKTNKPLYNAIVWNDCRTINICKKLKNKYKRADFFKDKNGLLIDSYFSLFKLLWLLENVKKVKECYDKNNLLIGTIDSWLLYNITKEKNHLTDVTNASRTFLMNLESLDWDNNILKEFNLKRNILPGIKSSTSLFGKLNIKGYEHIKITGVMGDQQAASLGMGLCDKKRKEKIKITYGSGIFMIISSGEIKKFKDGFLTTLLYKNQNNKAIYGLEGSIESGGNTLNFLSHNLKIKNLRELDTEKIQKNKLSYDKLIFTPPISNIMSPFWQETSGGSIINMNYNTQIEDIYRSCLECSAFRVNQCLNNFGNLKEDILVDGGMTNNEYLMQFQSNISKKNIKCMDFKDCTLFGVYLASGIFDKDFFDLDCIHNELLSKFKIFSVMDNKKYSDFIEKKYQQFDQAIKSSFINQ